MTGKKIREYVDFEIRIDPKEERQGYPVSASGPAGNAVRDLFVVNEQELRSHRLRIEEIILWRGLTRKASPEMELARSLGAKLFEALPEPVRDRYSDSLNLARRDNKGLRVKLRIDPRATELLGLPWEFLYDGRRGQFIGLGKNTPLVRYVPLPYPPEPFRVTSPLHILVLIANPADCPVPGVQEEKRRIVSALQPLKDTGLVEFEIVEGKDTFAVLRSRLRQLEVNVLHFIGHGEFDEDAEAGSLLFEDEAGVSRPATAEQIRAVVGDEPSVRLVVLNACEGAQLAKTDAFTGVAMALVQSGIPAVMAMQFEITGPAAVAFSREFYESVADGYPVDAAVTQGRIAVFTELGTVEWGTPVLFMRAPDGVIFEVAEAPFEVAETPKEPYPPPSSKPVRLVCRSPRAWHAKQVYVAGEFNDWLRAEEGTIRPTTWEKERFGMEKHTKEGKVHWEKEIWILPGEWHFKFVADGNRWIHWYEDSGYQRGSDAAGGPNYRVFVEP
jgi:hypothetical protein